MVDNNFRLYPDRVTVDRNGVDVANSVTSGFKLRQREPFIFRVGNTALASGMVASGTRSGGPTVASTSANVTVWGDDVLYEPFASGKVDGVTTGGIISGQVTVGVICSAAASVAAKLTARIRNKDGTYVTALALTGSFNAGGTTEIFNTYDLPHLLTVANFNAVPFQFAIGVQGNLASTFAVARIMESSYIQGEIEAGS